MTPTESAATAAHHTPPAPGTLSKSLERAVADGRTLLARDEPIEIDSSAQHRGAHAVGPRTVGAAGAVMAVSLNVGADAYATVESFSPAWGASLQAIERMRAGDWTGAWRTFHGPGGTAEVPSPAVEFANRIEAALGWAKTRSYWFVTAEDYRAWLDDCERAILDALDTVEAALVAEVAASLGTRAPETLARAMRIALADGRALTQDARSDEGRYRFDASRWHAPHGERRDTCTVCAAGAVMAGTLRCPPDATAYPDSFAYPWECVFKSINGLRLRDWRSAFGWMHGARHPGWRVFTRAMKASAPSARGAADDFTGRTQYEAWLDYVETALLPALDACEAQALSSH